MVKMWLVTLVMATGLITIASHSALADSSGNFTADLETSACALNVNSGALSCPGGAAAGICIDNLTAQIFVSSGSGNSLLVTPSLVTGLLTDTNLVSGGKNSTSQSVTAAVVAHVTLKRPDGTVVAVSPDVCTKMVNGSCTETAGVVYDERFQQLSTNIFNVLTNCSSSSASSTACNLELVLSTLNAHSFNFVAPQAQLEQGTDTLNVGLELDCFNNGAPVTCGSALPTGAVNACAGPGTLTVEQVKAFSNGGGITD